MSKEMILDALNSRYCCLKEPLPYASAALHHAYDRRYLTSLRVFCTREDEEPQSPQTLGQHIIDPQILKEKITATISAISFRDPHVLVQFWSPVTFLKRCMLTTLDQPFGIGVVNEALYKYRLESEQRMFAVDGEHIEELGGSPGRVYRQKFPEWSLDIQGLPTSQNIKDSTACHNINGYISLPVVDPASGCCVGVLELITLSKHVDYAFEVIEISKALKEQDLKTSNAFEEPSFCKLPSEDWQIQMQKINDILIVMCDTHNLPLAQTWELSPFGSHVLHEKSIQKSCSSFNRRCIGKVCMSTAGLPFYVRDLSMWEFHKACMEQHLEKSQGVVGRALLSHCASYCENVTKLSEEEYPLVRNACTSGLGGCLAIFLHGVEGKNDYILEFFLPLDIKDSIDSYVLNLVQKLKLKIEDASGFEMGDISSMEVIRPRSVVNNISSMTEVDTPNGIIPHPFVTNVATIACGAYANVRMQKTRDMGNDAGEPSNRLNKKRKLDSLTMEAVVKLFGQPMDEACKSLEVSRSTLKRFLRDKSVPRWPIMSKLSDRSACVTDSNQNFLVSRSTMMGFLLDHNYIPRLAMSKLSNRSLIFSVSNTRSVTDPNQHFLELLKRSTGVIYSNQHFLDKLFKRSTGVLLFISFIEIIDHRGSVLELIPVWFHSSGDVSFLTTVGARGRFPSKPTLHVYHVAKLIVCLRRWKKRSNVNFAMAHQDDSLMFGNTTNTEQTTDNVDPLMARTAMAHHNDLVVFDGTTYMEQTTNNVDPLMDFDLDEVTNMNFVDAIPMLSGPDIIDDQGSSWTEVEKWLMDDLPPPIGSDDTSLLGANPTNVDFPNLIDDDQSF